MSVIDTLDRLDIDYRRIGDEAWAQCPGHVERTGHADSNPSWSINISTGAHYCFSCGYRGSLVALVRDVLGLDSVAEAKAVVGTEEVDPAHVVQKVRRRKVGRITRTSEAVERAEYLSFDEVSDGMAATRGLTAATCAQLGIRSRDGAWVLPVYDVEDEFLGWQEKDGSRVRNRPLGIQKSRSLFGLGEFGSEELVVVESPLDAALCQQAGVPAVATYGTSVSYMQMVALAPYVPVLAFDNDAPGRRATEEVSARLRELGILHRVLLFGPDEPKDFGDFADPMASIPQRVSQATWGWELSRA